MNHTDSRAGQHRYGKLRDHGHIQGNPIPLLEFLLFQDVGKLADLSAKLLVRINPVLSIRLSLPNESGFVLVAIPKMSIQTVERDI
jgi:hypothetical protein